MLALSIHFSGTLTTIYHQCWICSVYVSCTIRRPALLFENAGKKAGHRKVSIIQNCTQGWATILQGYEIKKIEMKKKRKSSDMKQLRE
jgi:hypothetical protein